MDAAMERPLGEAAIGSGQEIFPPDQPGKPHDAFSHQFGMFDNVGGMADHARKEQSTGWQFCAFPDPPLMFVPRIGAFDDIGANLHAQYEVDNVAERYVAGMRSRPASPADVVTDAVGGQPRYCFIEHIDLQFEPLAVIGKARRRHHAVIGDRSAWSSSWSTNPASMIMRYSVR